MDTKQPNETETVIKSKLGESDYYSDVDEDYEQDIEKIRTVKKWITLGMIAFSFIGFVVLLIILIHLKSRKASRLMYLT